MIRVSHHATERLSEMMSVSPRTASGMIARALTSIDRIETTPTGALFAFTKDPGLRLVLDYREHGVLTVVTVRPRERHGRGKAARDRKLAAQAYDYLREQRRSLCFDH